MPRKGKVSYLQIEVYDKHEGSKEKIEAIHRQSYWTIEESIKEVGFGFGYYSYITYLIRFESIADRKRFTCEYGDGTHSRRNSAMNFAYKWKDVPHFFLTKIPDLDESAGTNVIFPDISKLEWGWHEYPELYEKLEILYKTFGADPKKTSVIPKSKIIETIKNSIK